MITLEAFERVGATVGREFARACENEGASGSFEVLRRALAGLGYLLLEDFKVVKEP